MQISALVLFFIGKLRLFSSDYQNALEELQEAKGLLINVNYLSEAADCVFGIARCFGGMGQYMSALEAADETIQLFENLGLHSRTSIFVRKGRYLKGAGFWDDRLYSTLQVALERSQEVGVPGDTALTLAEFGEIYVKRKDWVAARLAYEGALKEIHEFSDSEKDLVSHCCHNLRYIEAQETDCLDDTIDFQVPKRR
jgi:tetratricopeptide (TPR) repeat protein